MHSDCDRKRHEVERTEICGVSPTKNPLKTNHMLGKFGKILRKILCSYLCSLGMSVFMVLARR